MEKLNFPKAEALDPSLALRRWSCAHSLDEPCSMAPRSDSRSLCLLAWCRQLVDCARVRVLVLVPSALTTGTQPDPACHGAGGGPRGTVVAPRISHRRRCRSIVRLGRSVEEGLQGLGHRSHLSFHSARREGEGSERLTCRCHHLSGRMGIATLAVAEGKSNRLSLRPDNFQFDRVLMLRIWRTPIPPCGSRAHACRCQWHR